MELNLQIIRKHPRLRQLHKFHEGLSLIFLPFGQLILLLLFVFGSAWFALQWLRNQKLQPAYAGDKEFRKDCFLIQDLYVHVCDQFSDCVRVRVNVTIATRSSYFYYYRWRWNTHSRTKLLWLIILKHTITFMSAKIYWNDSSTIDIFRIFFYYSNDWFIII